jgi:hypothetical protein
MHLARAPTRAAAPTTYRRDAIDHRQECDDIGHI